MKASTSVAVAFVFPVAFAFPGPGDVAVLLGPKPPVMMGPKASVLELMMMLDTEGASEIRVPLRVTAGPPGMRV